MSFIGQTSLPSNANFKLDNIPCDSSVAVGDFVRIDSFSVAQRALADTFDNSNLIGVVEEKLNSTSCNIRFLGASIDVFVGLDPTKEYYLSDTLPGKITTTVPTASGHVIIKVGQPITPTQLLILKGNRIIRG